MSKTSIVLCLGAALIGAALLYIRDLSTQFYFGTVTADHPYGLFVASLIVAGLVWSGLIPVLKTHISHSVYSARTLWIIIMTGIFLRGIFIGSNPIYEDDWKRYLWDGLVTSQNINPYHYSPQQIIDASKHASQGGSTDLIRLSELSNSHGNYVELINSRALTTIYPPIAMAVFTISAKVKALDLDVLRVIFLLSEALSLFLMSKALAAYGRSPLWASLYAFNPLVIYTGINAAHMDVLIVPFLMWALLAIKRHPLWAGLALSCAVAVKIWPLILAPILYRNWLNRPYIYIGSAFLILGLTLAVLAPMLLHLGEYSGASAYAQTWQKNSFLFPNAENLLSFVTEDSSRAARILIAIVTVMLSLWLGFSHIFSGKSAQALDQNLPSALLCVTLIFFFLSPTGFPWYAIWLIAFLPFAPVYGVAILTATLPLYYLRFALGEAGQYHIYIDYLVPIQFCLPLLTLLFEYMHARKQKSQKG